MAQRCAGPSEGAGLCRISGLLLSGCHGEAVTCQSCVMRQPYESHGPFSCTSTLLTNETRLASCLSAHLVLRKGPCPHSSVFRAPQGLTPHSCMPCQPGELACLASTAFKYYLHQDSFQCSQLQVAPVYAFDCHTASTAPQQTYNPCASMVLVGALPWLLPQPV